MDFRTAWSGPGQRIGPLEVGFIRKSAANYILYITWRVPYGVLRTLYGVTCLYNTVVVQSTVHRTAGQRTARARAYGLDGLDGAMHFVLASNARRSRFQDEPRETRNKVSAFSIIIGREWCPTQPQACNQGMPAVVCHSTPYWWAVRLETTILWCRWLVVMR